MKNKKIILLSCLSMLAAPAFSETNINDLQVGASIDKSCIFYYESIYEIGRVESPATNTTFNLDQTVNIPFGYKCTNGTAFTFKMINDTWQEPIVKVTGIKMSAAGSGDFLSGIIKDLDLDLNIHHTLYPKTYTSDGKKKVFNWNFRVENPVRTSGRMPKEGYYSGTARFEFIY